jgi:ABC-2 type transport system permease protein
MNAVTDQPPAAVEPCQLADVTDLGRPINGPAAYTGDLTRFWHLTFNIAKTQWKMRFFGSVLGYLWQIIRPLMLFGVLYLFFTKVAHINRGVPDGPGQPGQFYGAQLLGAIILFSFFTEATSTAVRAVVDNEALVRKIQFPRLAIPLSAVLVALFNVSLNLLVVMLFAILSGVRPMLTWLELPLVLLWVALFATGFATLLSALFVYFRDIQPIWEVITQIWFYASPVMIPVFIVRQRVSSTALKVYMANPMAAALEQFKHAMISHGVPGVGAAFYGGRIWVLVPAAIVVTVVCLGFWVFNRTAPYVAENI